MAAYKLQGRRTWKGLDVSIENRKGSVRHWNDGQRSGSTKMKWSYGYIRRTQAADGDHVDVYLGPDPDGASHVYVVRQMAAPTFRRYDEDKCMIGWPSEAAARLAYLGQYDDPRFLGRIDAIPVDRFVRQAQKTFDKPGRVQKAIPRPPGAGWQAIPGGHVGGWRKPDGKGGWTYQYADHGRTGHGGQLALFDWAAPKPRQPLPSDKLEQYRAEISVPEDFRTTKLFTSVVALEARSLAEDLVRDFHIGTPSAGLSAAIYAYQKRAVEIEWVHVVAASQIVRLSDELNDAGGELLAGISDQTLTTIAQAADGEGAIAALIEGIGQEQYALAVADLGEPIVEAVAQYLPQKARYRIASDAHLHDKDNMQALGKAPELRALYDALRPSLPVDAVKNLEAHGAYFQEPEMRVPGHSPGHVYRAIRAEHTKTAPLGHWGSAESHNEIAKATAWLGDSGRLRPLDENMRLTPVDVQDVDVRNAKRRYVYAQDMMAATPRKAHPCVFRGMQLSEEVLRTLAKSSIVPLTGCTAFSFDRKVAKEYTDSAWTTKKTTDRDAAPVLIEMVRDDLFDATVAGWHPNKDDSSRPAFEIVSGANALEIVSVEPPKPRDTGSIEMSVRVTMPIGRKMLDGHVDVYKIMEYAGSKWGLTYRNGKFGEVAQNDDGTWEPVMSQRSTSRQRPAEYLHNTPAKKWGDIASLGIRLPGPVDKTWRLKVRAVLEGDSVSKARRPTRDSAWRRAVVVLNQALADQPLRQDAPPTHKTRRVGLAGLVKAAGGHKYIRRTPTGDPKRPWRYDYAEGHKPGKPGKRRVTPKRKPAQKVKKGEQFDLFAPVADYMPETPPPFKHMLEVDPAKPWTQPDWAPDLADYDYIAINSSGGKDSQAQLTHVVELCDKQGVPRDKIVVVHADLGRVEWDGTKELAQLQAEHYGVRFEAVQNPDGDLIEGVMQRFDRLRDRRADGEKLAQNGITTWQQLADADPAIVEAYLGDPEHSRSFDARKRGNLIQTKARSELRRRKQKSDANAVAAARATIRTADHVAKWEGKISELRARSKLTLRQDAQITKYQAQVVGARRKLRERLDEFHAYEADDTISFGAVVPWPSAAARWCTSDWKTRQVRKLYTQLSGEGGRDDKTKILSCLGIRAQESPERAKKAGYKVGIVSTTNQRVDEWYPIFGWPEEQVWNTIEDSEVPHHDAYDKGMKRLSCVFCVFAPKEALAIAAEHNPKLFKAYLELEQKVGASFKPGESLQEVVALLKERNGGHPMTTLERRALQKALAELDMGPLVDALITGLTLYDGPVQVDWKDGGACVHLYDPETDKSPHIAWMPDSIAGAGSLVALACANAAGVGFAENGAPPPKGGEALKKVTL